MPEWKRWHQGWMSPWGTTIAILRLLCNLQEYIYTCVIGNIGWDCVQGRSPLCTRLDQTIALCFCTEFCGMHIKNCVPQHIVHLFSCLHGSRAEREVMSWLMDFQPGAGDYLSDRGQIFEYTMHMSIHWWCHLIRPTVSFSIVQAFIHTYQGIIRHFICIVTHKRNTVY